MSFTIRRMCSGSSSMVMEKEEQEENKVWPLCGLSYWVQGFRCFPWLALNFHMVHALRISPSTLQLVQSCANLPLVAKPLFGVISDAVYIGGAHRIPYISFGVFLQIIAWGALALIPSTMDTFPAQMAFILLTNLGASFTEVVSDALVAEFSRAQTEGKLQSYAFIALTAGAISGNLSGGFIMLRTQEPKLMFFAFALLLSIQFALSLITKETSLYPAQCTSHYLVQNSLPQNLRKQFSELMAAISEERILYPLLWIVSSISVVPILSGAMFCFQTQCLNLDPSIIGLSKVVGQSMVLLTTIFYNRYLKRIPMRKLIFGVQIVYALALLSDLFLVKQINLTLGISNEAYVLCLSALAEAVAQFKILPFTVLISSLCPPGSEGSLFAFFTSALCLSSILSGIFGVGVASIIGVSSGDYSSLPFGIVLQSLASLVPLGWISHVPADSNSEGMKKKRKK
ncbi:LOW QUALITY PROTEIN: probable folate-biopterin transporter 9, chloroplastic [Dioscorea cayenensis subsp. rotundata]|uniref:LOW QUALITY PROTEIN: probable folate-biopterin transporter 9, chloroplastic n=1 Tax=Dioscorea cayennensis subsp. rotundata TaxID=55577 RepID=A0AB40BY50_DIOCR|nr:LOW QUALITY PROTEIN: probable folate-biopterin transporter 9, chloroplastic [Dioscorea cayenensis subsp. rotundata]